MTITTTIIKNSYDGDGNQAAFQFNFKVLDQADIEVLIRAADGTETKKTIQTHYTVSGVGVATGGSVTFTVGNIPAATEKVILRRATAQTQVLDLVENDPFSAESIEAALDRTIAINQELQEQVDRAIKLSPTNAMSSTEFTVDATNRQNKVLAFDGAGELSIAQTLGDYQGNWNAGRTYGERDLVKDTSNNNIYLCVTAHSSSGAVPLSSNADIAKWALIVDAEAAATASNTATTKASEALSSAQAADASATTASGHATTASNAQTAAESARDIAVSSRDTAISQAGIATTKAGEADQSAQAAAQSAQSAAASSGGAVVKVSTNDTNANTLSQKIEGGLGIKAVVKNSGGNEKLQINSDAIVFAIALGG